MQALLPRTEDRAAFKNMNRIGSPARVDKTTVQLDEWARVKDENGNEDGTIQRVRMRHLSQVYRDLVGKLDVLVCEKCKHERKRPAGGYGQRCKKCKEGDEYSFIDEYFSGPDKDGPVPHDFRWIACYPVTGGSEGHYVHIEFISPVPELEVFEGPFADKHLGKATLNHLSVWKITRLALGKTFRGMDHAAEMARRCAVLLGA